MKHIKIEYPYLFFFRKSKEITVPDEWINLSQEQFAICAEAIVGNVSDDLFVSKFFGLKEGLVKKLSKYEQYKLIEQISFITNPQATVNFFYLDSIPGTELVAPEEKLKNVSIEHFMLFDTFFFDYVNKPSIENLQRFVASLYLKQGEKLTSVNFDERVKYIANNVASSYLNAIFLNYTFIRKWLSSVFSYLFEYKEDESENENKLKRNQANLSHRPDWNAILDGLIGDDILKEEEYRKLPCLRAFKTINNRIKQYRLHGK